MFSPVFVLQGSEDLVYKKPEFIIFKGTVCTCWSYKANGISVHLKSLELLFLLLKQVVPATQYQCYQPIPMKKTTPMKYTKNVLKYDIVL